MTEFHKFTCDKCGHTESFPAVWSVEPFRRYLTDAEHEFMFCYRCDNYVRNAIIEAKKHIIEEFMNADLDRLVGI